MIPVLWTPYLLGRRVELCLRPHPRLLVPREIAVVTEMARRSDSRWIGLQTAQLAAFDPALASWRRSRCTPGMWIRFQDEIERLTVLDDIDPEDGALTFRAIERRTPSTAPDPAL